MVAKGWKLPQRLRHFKFWEWVAVAYFSVSLQHLEHTFFRRIKERLSVQYSDLSIVFSEIEVKMSVGASTASEMSLKSLKKGYVFVYWSYISQFSL